MTWWGWLILGLVLAAAFLVVLLWQLASRLDRLHRRVLTARGGLERGLVKRNAELLRTSDLSGVPADSAEEMRQRATDALALSEIPLVADGLRPGSGMDGAEVDRRLLAESRVSRAMRDFLTPELRSTLSQNAVAQAQLEALDLAAYRVEVARTLHNQDVTQARALRSRLIVRLFHLAGRAPMPNFVDLDDQTK